MIAQLDMFDAPDDPRAGSRWHNARGTELAWCWGRCGGWGWREVHLAAIDELPCDVPGCLREHGHDGPHNPRVWERR